MPRPGTDAAPRAGPAEPSGDHAAAAGVLGPVEVLVGGAQPIDRAADALAEQADA